MMQLDPPVPVTPRNWYCQQMPGAEISLAENHLMCWNVVAIHARYLAQHPRRIGSGTEVLRAFLVDLASPTLPDLTRAIVYQEPGGRWFLKQPDEEVSGAPGSARAAGGAARGSGRGVLQVPGGRAGGEGRAVRDPG